MEMSLDLHDFSVPNNRMDLLIKLRRHFKNFKVSLFTVPHDVKHERKRLRGRDLWKIRGSLGWIQIIPHGLHHNSAEARKWSYDHFRNIVMPKINNYFERDGLPYEKGFCAPHWMWNKDVVQALNDEGWWGAVSKDKKRMLYTKKYYEYDTPLDKLPEVDLDKVKVLKLHGHINGTSKDDLEKWMDKLLELPKDVKWHFVTDFVI